MGTGTCAAAAAAVRRSSALFVRQSLDDGLDRVQAVDVHVRLPRPRSGDSGQPRDPTRISATMRGKFVI